MNMIFSSLFESTTANISILDFSLSLISSLILGLLICLTYMYKSKYTTSFITTIAILPAIVCIIIMMVNGNIGTGIAVGGAFSLVRFRSMPATAKELCALFLGMATGMMCGMGYIGFAFIFVILMSLILMIYSMIDLGKEQTSYLEKELHITIPESLNYHDVFDSIFEQFTSKYELTSVKTSNMGSLYKLSYEITLKQKNSEKDFMDELRVRNGNLEIKISNKETNLMGL